MTPALIVSIVAIAMSSVTLSWQVWSWRQSGPVIGVTANQALPTYDHGAGDWHIQVTARNTGRAPVQVASWAFALPNDRSIIVQRPASWSTPLPHALPNGSSASWYVPTDEIKRQCAEIGVRYQDLRAVVSLGTGVTVKARARGIGLK